MSAAGNSEIGPDVQLPATPSGKDSKVRTLSEPPDIWELVHETRTEFKPGSAFFGHLKAHSLVLFVILLLAGTGGVFGVMKFRVWSESSPTAPPAPAETSKSVLNPPPALPNPPSADQSTKKAPSSTEPVVSTVDQPKTAPAVPAASSETKVSAAPSDSKVVVTPRPQSTPTAKGETVAARNKEKTKASKLTAASPTAVRTDKKNGNQAVPTPLPKSDKQQAGDPTVTKKEPDRATSPQPVTPAKVGTPKPKVIPWP